MKFEGKKCGGVKLLGRVLKKSGKVLLRILKKVGKVQVRLNKIEFFPDKVLILFSLRSLSIKKIESKWLFLSVYLRLVKQERKKIGS